MNGRLEVLVLLVASLGVLGVLGLAVSDRIEGPSPDTASSVSQGYPPPPTAPTPTSIPTPDASGYLPAPVGVTTTVVTLGASPYSDLLVPLQGYLDNGDAASIADHASGTTEAYMSFEPISGLGGGRGSKAISREDAEQLLSDFFNEGSEPLIQGYFAIDTPWPEETACLEVIMFEYSGVVPFPTPKPGGFGVSTPDYVPPGAMSFRFCDYGGPQGWEWQSWYYGEYYRTLEVYSFVGEWIGETYYVVRP